LILLLAAAFVPNERDRALVTLPPALAFLYYLVRPVRLALALANCTILKTSTPTAAATGWHR
jgi:hypothetical protein